MKRHFHVHWKDVLRCNYLLLVAAATTVVLSSCDLFKTREPQTPNENGTTVPPATTPDQLYSNIQETITLENAQGYEQLFSDVSQGERLFVFVPNQSALARYSAVFSHWNRDSEGDYFRKAMASLPPSSTPQISFDSEHFDSFPPDSGLYSVTYTLFLNHGQANLPTTFRGRAFFYVAQSASGFWKIYRWEDYETDKDSSWSELKGYFGQ